MIAANAPLAKTPAQVIASAGTGRSKSRGPKKSLDAGRALPQCTTTEPTKTEETLAPVPSPVEQKTATQKERSQSRKRASGLFGSILGKKDDTSTAEAKDKKAEHDVNKAHKAEEKKVEHDVNKAHRAEEKKVEHDIKKEHKAEEKKAEHDIKKEHKAEEKAEKKEHKQVIKEEKKEEAAIKKEEAKHHDTSKIDAAETAAVASLPSAAVVAADKNGDKKDTEHQSSGTTTPTDKKAKRGSVFGSLFGKKGVTSPATEKSEKEVGPATPAKDTEPVLPVSETAPQIDQPVTAKPIDTAAVTAPVDSMAAEPAHQEPTKETAPITTGETTPKTEKKGGFLAGIIKKAEGKKDEPKEPKADKIHEPLTKESTTPAPLEPTKETAPVTTESPITKEERPAREKRRGSSLFTSLSSGLGTMKRKNKDETSPAKSATIGDKTALSDSTTNGDKAVLNDSTVNGDKTTVGETKREKSPLPSKIGGLFRKPSKAVKSSQEPTSAVEHKTEAPITESTPEINGTSTVDGNQPSSSVPEGTDSKIVGDVVPEELHATVHDAVTTAPPEVKASA